MLGTPFFIALFNLSLIFFRVGLFTVGGGLVAITLMSQELIPAYLDENSFYSFIAVAESTPGPIGVNMSTYIGYERLGIIGAICITLAFVTPSFLSILAIAKMSSSFQDNKVVQKCFYGLKAASASLICVAVYRVFVSSVMKIELFRLHKSYLYLLGYKEAGFFVLLLLFSMKMNKDLHPIFLILLGAVFGIVFL